jgi:microcystin degradation protein MlrC
MLSNDTVASESPGNVWNAEPSAVLKKGNMTLIVTIRPVSLYDRSLFLGHGQDPRAFDAVVVKSPHCQPHFFAEWAQMVLNVDAPGSTSANLPSLGHTRCRRPMYPLEQDAEFEPVVQVFDRSRRTLSASSQAGSEGTK